MKSKMYQQYILKLNSSKILKAKKDLKITLKEARQNKELVSLGDSNCLRMIDKINGVDRNKVLKLNFLGEKIAEKNLPRIEKYCHAYWLPMFCCVMRKSFGFGFDRMNKMNKFEYIDFLFESPQRLL